MMYFLDPWFKADLTVDKDSVVSDLQHEVREYEVWYLSGYVETPNITQFETVQHYKAIIINFTIQ